jgi:hypothetical protein
MIGVPARTAEDALAAIDFLIRENASFEDLDYDNHWGRVMTSLVDAIRGYIVSTGRLA